MRTLIATIAIVLGLSLTTPAYAAEPIELNQPTMRIIVGCDGYQGIAEIHIEGTGYVTHAATRYGLTGLALPVTKQIEVGPGFLIVGALVGPDPAIPSGETVDADATVPDCEGPGVKPRDRMVKKTRRSCKAKAKVKVRAVFIDWVVETDGTGDESWQAKVSRTGWSRVLPTPRGCVLRHREWVRNHRGHRR